MVVLFWVIIYYFMTQSNTLLCTYHSIQTVKDSFELSERRCNTFPLE